MNAFQFYAPTRLVFGRGEENNIGSLLAPMARRVLLVYGGGSIKKSGLYDRICRSLSEAGIMVHELGGVQPNPRLAQAYQGIELCRREGIELVLAVGGGSAIDMAKAVAVGTVFDGDVWDLYLKKAQAKKALPVACVLTIPAAGSEMSNCSVISNADTEQKYGIHYDFLYPVLSVVNPELFYTLPKNQLANGVADMLSHVFERYFTNTTHTDMTDELCEGVMRTLLRNAPLALANPENFDAWSELGFAGTLAHNGLVGMGRAQSWACHQMEHELSAIYDVAHGAGLAVLTPHWMRYVYKSNIPMFAQFAAQVMGLSGSLRDPEALALAGIERLSRFFAEMGLPQTLTELGIGSGKLELMARKATRIEYGTENPLGGVMPIYWQDVLAIYRAAL